MEQSGVKQYIFTFETEDQEREFLDLAVRMKVKPRWIVIDPNPEYDQEWTFTDETAWDELGRTLDRVLNQTGEEPTWPQKPLELWETEERRDLVQRAVTQWNYLKSEELTAERVAEIFPRKEIHQPTEGGGPPREESPRHEA